MSGAPNDLSTTTTTAAAASGPRSGAVHIGYLDGIRGLAALYVLLEHVQLNALDLIGGRTVVAPGTPDWLLTLARFLNSSVLGFGHLAVNVFIVLSGYCLMLPVAQAGDGTLRGGFAGYIKRRAWRILPPYYAALVISVLLFPLFTGRWPDAGQLASHALLVHNWTPQWLYGINAPFWSVAVEWQIYFVFALLLLPVFRRWGGLATLAAACVLGVVPLYVLPMGRNFEWSCPWYVVLFALGMLAAWAGVAPGAAKSRAARVPWNVMTILAGLATVAVFLLPRVGPTQQLFRDLLRMEHRGGSWLLDVCVGLTVACMLLALTRSVVLRSGRLNLALVAVLESRPVRGLGAFSYSLYLIHAPIAALVILLIGRLGLTPLAAYVTQWIIAVPLGLIASYVFYLAVERQCLTRKSTKRAATAPAPEPKPLIAPSVPALAPTASYAELPTA